MSELKPCPFCNGEDAIFEDNTYWTGTRSEILSVTMRHWCNNSGGLPRSSHEITAKTKEGCVDIWNTRHYPRCKDCRERVRSGYCKVVGGFPKSDFGCAEWEGRDETER